MKDKYRLDMEKILSDLKIKIPKGYIEVKRAENDTKKDSSHKKTKQDRQ
jgi:hypothetical protein